MRPDAGLSEAGLGGSAAWLGSAAAEGMSRDGLGVRFISTPHSGDPLDMALGTYAGPSAWLRACCSAWSRESPYIGGRISTTNYME